MKKAKNIHSLDSLERELYRLSLEARNIEEKLDHNLDHLQDNYVSMTMNSLFHHTRLEGEGKPGYFDTFFKSEAFNSTVAKLTEHIADKAANGIDSLIDKLLHKAKNP